MFLDSNSLCVLNCGKGLISLQQQHLHYFACCFFDKIQVLFVIIWLYLLSGNQMFIWLLFNLKDMRPILLDFCWKDCRIKSTAAAWASEMQRKVSLLFFQSVFFPIVFIDKNLDQSSYKHMPHFQHLQLYCNVCNASVALQNPMIGSPPSFWENSAVSFFFFSFVLKNKILIWRKSIKMCHQFTTKA